MVNKFIHYQLLDEREEQLINKAGAESFFTLYWACTSKLFGGSVWLHLFLIRIF